MGKQAAGKNAALDAAIQQIERQYGKGSIIKMNQGAQAMPCISTGSLGLDIALGIGGIPRSRIIECYGSESSGKTTLALMMAAQAQRAGDTVAFIDAEHALDKEYARNLGVDVDALHCAQPDHGEAALGIVDILVRSNAVQFIIVDSVAALTPKAEIEGEMGDSHVGLQARLMSQALRKLTGSISKSNCTVLFINQTRMKIGVMFGNPETTTGGNALKFYSSVRLDVRRIGSVKEGDDVIGNETRVKVVKNKVAPPFKKAEFQILYGKGVNATGEILDYGVEKGLIVKKGAWYSYQGQQIGQGKGNACQWLDDNAGTREALKADILAMYLPNPEMVNSSEEQTGDTEEPAPDQAGDYHNYTDQDDQDSLDLQT